MIYGVEASVSSALAGPTTPNTAVVIDNSVTSNGIVVASQATADNSMLTISAWVRCDDYSNSPYILTPGGPAAGFAGTVLFLDFAGAVRFDIKNSAHTKSLSVGSTSGVEVFSQGPWHHIFISVNTNFGSGAKLSNVLLDGVDVNNSKFDSDTAFNIGISGKAFGIPCEQAEMANISDIIELAFVWVAVGQYVTAANVTLFRDGGGNPVDLGADGSTPTGTAPTYYLVGPAANFSTNLGTGGAVTLVGSITDAANGPP